MLSSVAICRFALFTLPVDPQSRFDLPLSAAACHAQGLVCGFQSLNIGSFDTCAPGETVAEGVRQCIDSGEQPLSILFQTQTAAEIPGMIKQVVSRDK